MLIWVNAGLEYLHDAGLIHGDLKSANVQLKSTGTDQRGFVCKVRLLRCHRLLPMHLVYIRAAPLLSLIFTVQSAFPSCSRFFVYTLSKQYHICFRFEWSL